MAAVDVRGNSRNQSVNINGRRPRNSMKEIKMNEYQATASAIVDASPEKVYRIISDYHQGHPAILPSRYFAKLDVIGGGRGAGTEVTVHMKVFGVKALYHLEVSEPEPGRLLVEEDETAGVHTSFAVEPVNGGNQARVTISTQARTSPGLKGVVEKWMNPWVTRRIYQEELQQLARVASEA
jgi:hypothetical protein